jgi:hypothetical protein
MSASCPLYPRKRTWFGTVAGGNGRRVTRRERVSVLPFHCIAVWDTQGGPVWRASACNRFTVPPLPVTSAFKPSVPGRPAREVDIIADQRPYDGWVLAVLLLDQLASVLVILAAAWLVWTRPGIMTWGFFLYVIWFNPGQSAEYYALLQRSSPIALLTQNIAGAIALADG